METEVIKCIRNTNSQLKISSKKKRCQKLVFVCLIFFNKHWRIQSSVEGFLRHVFSGKSTLTRHFPSIHNDNINSIYLSSYVPSTLRSLPSKLTNSHVDPVT